MIVYFTKQYLLDLYTKGEADKKHRFQPEVIRKYVMVVNIMRNVADITKLWQYKSLHYKKLTGNKSGISSVRVTSQYRVEFTEQTKDGQEVATICNITELSNHYDD